MSAGPGLRSHLRIAGIRPYHLVNALRDRAPFIGFAKKAAALGNVGEDKSNVRARFKNGHRFVGVRGLEDQKAGLFEADSQIRSDKELVVHDQHGRI